MKKCVLILPYFGKFNNYFQLFLKSFSYNTSFDLLIFTNNNTNYLYPDNVKIIPFSIDMVKERLEKVVGQNVCLEYAYKLCDYKPMYGAIFDDYIKGYAYWGHCDCDLLFGDLENELLPLLKNNLYEKIFAAGHLTLYLNNYNNNHLFMEAYNGKKIYQDVISSNDIYVFDEDYKDNNIHRIFLQYNKKIYDNDMSMNPTSIIARFRRSYYSPKDRRFVWETMVKARYYWMDGKIFRLMYNKERDEIDRTDYLYMHLQLRTMHVPKEIGEFDIIEILPDRFVGRKKLPDTKRKMCEWGINLPNTYWMHIYMKKIKRKLIRFLK